MTVPLISVVTCTHNPNPSYFQRVLDALRAQTLSFDRWEYIVIDNRSRQPVAETFEFAWAPNARLVREETLGLTPTRLRGIREARGELLVFVDDDNVLNPDFLEQAALIARERPHLGAWSGQCRAGFEQNPADWTRRYWGNLVIREFDQDVWSNLPLLPATMPCGAGLCVRREVALEYLRMHESGARSFQFDRTGGSLLSGGDNDLAACACDIGLGVGLVTAMKLEHLISLDRLTEDYLSRLAEGIYISAVVLAHLRGEADDLASYRVRWRELIRAIFQPRPHRSIALAALSGRRKGLALVAGTGGPDA